MLKHPPEGPPKAADFECVSAARPSAPSDGLLVRTVYLSLDPYVGSVIRGRHMGEPPLGAGAVIPGRAIAEVVESRAEGYTPGDFVNVETGWREYAACPAEDARPVERFDGLPLSLHLGVLGMPGLTAWASVHHLAEVRDGDIVLVSSAAGPVGGSVGQIARIQGAARVVGVAGGGEKCAVVTGRYGFDDCVDYRQDGWQQTLAAALPDGVAVYHDNVGGEMLETALGLLNNYGRVVLCGLASQYHADERPPGPNPGLFIAKRARLMGLVVYDFHDEQQEYARRAAEWVRDGRLAYLEDRAADIEQTPAQFERLMRGENVGKCLVIVGPEQA